jgi:hypothetical protein
MGGHSSSGHRLQVEKLPAVVGRPAVEWRLFSVLRSEDRLERRRLMEG